MSKFLRLSLLPRASGDAYANLARKCTNCAVCRPARRIVTARLALLSALVLLPAFWAQSSHAECRINDVLFDVGGRPGSGVTAIDRSNPIALSDLKNWAVGDDVSTCDVAHLTTLDSAFANKTDFNDPIGSWDVSNVTSTGFLFRFMDFNQDISNWDTSSMTDMSGMFNYAYRFNQDISTKVVNAGTADEYIAWDVSNNRRLIYTFWGATDFNQNINNWNTSALTDLEYGFSGASSFNQDISTKTVTVGSTTYTAWDVRNVTDMYLAFSGTTVFDRDIGNWNVGNVTRFQQMFQSSSFNQDIGSWDTSRATQMFGMFNNNAVFNQDISGWDVSNVINMSNMFRSAVAFNQPIGTWDTGSNNNMEYMFRGASTFNQDLSAWDVSAVTNMRAAFELAGSLDTDLSSWDVSSVTNFQQTFGNATSFDQDIRNWAVSDAANLSSMFVNATKMIARFTGVTGFSTTPLPSFFNGNSENLAALTPTFGTPSATADGFTVQISNYSTDYTWGKSTTAGTVSISSNGLITVTGLTSGQSATVTVTTTRTGYDNGSAQVSGGAIADSDGDGINDNEDPFPLSDTEEATGGITLRTTPPTANSGCSIDSLAVTDVAAESPRVAVNGIGKGIAFALSGCDTSNLETLTIRIDLGAAPTEGSAAMKIDSDGNWSQIEGATIEGSLVTYTITDNGPLDQDSDPGTMADPVTVAVPYSAPALPVPTLPALLMGLLSLLLGLFGYRRLAH